MQDPKTRAKLARELTRANKEESDVLEGVEGAHTDKYFEGVFYTCRLHCLGIHSQRETNIQTAEEF